MRDKAEWAAKKFRAQDRSFSEYFNKQIRATKYILPHMDDYEINFTITNQLPLRARDALAHIDYAETDRIRQVLSRLDATHREPFNSYDKNAPQDRKSNFQAVNKIARSYSFKNFNGSRTFDGRENQNWRDNSNRRSEECLSFPTHQNHCLIYM